MISDLSQTTEILEKYADSRIDFTDCAIVAMAERLNIRKIMTVEHRHFRLFRSKHCSYFTLAPNYQI